MPNVSSRHRLQARSLPICNRPPSRSRQPARHAWKRRPPRWLAELRERRGAALSPAQLNQYLAQRLFNEIGLWYLQPLPPELVEAWIVAATDPAFCPAESGPSWLGHRAHRWALLPMATRASLLQAERHAIERLGDALTPPERPATGALDDAAAMLGRRSPRPGAARGADAAGGGASPAGRTNR